MVELLDSKGSRQKEETGDTSHLTKAGKKGAAVRTLRTTCKSAGRWLPTLSKGGKNLPQRKLFFVRRERKSPVHAKS